MKKLVTLICALVITGLYAQKSEVKALEKALKKPDYAAAKAAMQSAETLMGSMDEKTKEKYLVLKARTLYAGGSCTDDDLMKSLEALSSLKEMTSGKSRYQDEVDELRDQMYGEISREAQAAIDQGDNKTASKRFEQIYRIKPVDTTMLYYAASYAVNGGDYDTSLKYYNELVDLEYTGIQMNYYATNVANGEEEVFNDEKSRDFAVMSKEYTNPRDAMSSSKRGEIVKNIALIYVAQDKTDEALSAMAAARAENPEDLGLLLSEANVHLKMGNKEKFKALMEEATKQDPNNAELQYNLGVLAAEGGDTDAAKNYYKRALEIDPNYTDAYTNMAVVILSGEEAIVEEMNSLGTSAADNKKYDELKDQRSDLYRSAIPYLEKSLELNSKNINAAQTLVNIYGVLGETAKMKAMKEKVAQLEAGAGN
jgi:tetratricopeptide (TPR) repeat protein